MAANTDKAKPVTDRQGNASIDGDRPVKVTADDRLGFTPVTEKLAEAIVTQASPEGFVVGIEGEWGSGKSTLIHLTVDVHVNRRWIFTPDRRAIETPLVDGLERVGDLSCVA